MKKFNPKNKKTGAIYQIQYIEPMVVKDQDSNVRYLREASEVFTLLKDLQDSSKEKFIGIYMNSRNRILCIEVVHIGSTSESLVDSAAVLRTALLVNAKAIVIAHNHPSGDPSPSVEDKNITQRISAGCKLLNLLLQDHIIIGENCYYSFIEHGLL